MIITSDMIVEMESGENGVNVVMYYVKMLKCDNDTRKKIVTDAFNGLVARLPYVSLNMKTLNIPEQSIEAMIPVKNVSEFTDNLGQDFSWNPIANTFTI